MNDRPLPELEVNTTLNPDFGMSDEGALHHVKDLENWERPKESDSSPSV